MVNTAVTLEMARLCNCYAFKHTHIFLQMYQDVHFNYIYGFMVMSHIFFPVTIATSNLQISTHTRAYNALLPC